MVLTGPPSSRPDLVYFAYHITKDVGSMICGEVLEVRGGATCALMYAKISITRQGDLLQNRESLLSNRQNRWLSQRNLRAFYHNVAAGNIKEGVSAMLQLTGVGKLRPNTVVMGYKSDWNMIANEKLEEYFEIIHNTLDLNYGICIFRLRAGFDVRDRGGKANHYAAVSSRPQQQLPRNQSSNTILATTNPSSTDTVDSYMMAIERGPVNDQTPGGEESGTNNSSTEELITMPSRFEERQPTGFIDVWWLYDDGGTMVAYSAICYPIILLRLGHSTPLPVGTTQPVEEL